jgi:hypothetical protein
MLGYTPGQQAYKFLDLKQQMTISSWHIIFNEDGTFTVNELTPWTSSVSSSQWEGLMNQPRQPPEKTVDEGDDDKEFPAPMLK